METRDSNCGFLTCVWQNVFSLGFQFVLRRSVFFVCVVWIFFGWPVTIIFCWNYQLRISPMLRLGCYWGLLMLSQTYLLKIIFFPFFRGDVQSCQPATKWVAVAVTLHSPRVRQRTTFTLLIGSQWQRLQMAIAFGAFQSDHSQFSLKAINQSYVSFCTSHFQISMATLPRCCCLLPPKPKVFTDVHAVY